MAQLLETLRNRAKDSIKGRKLGLDLVDETLIGPKDIKRAVQDLTSATTATAANNYGVVVARLSGSATTAINGAFLLSNPIPGVAVDLCYALTSAGATAGSTAVAFQRPTTAFYIQSTATSTGVAILLAQGQSARLLGITTDAYMAQIFGTSAGPSVTVTS